MKKMPKKTISYKKIFWGQFRPISRYLGFPEGSFKERTYLNFDLIQWWTEIIVQQRVLPQILSQVLTNIQNVKKKETSGTKKFIFLHYSD